jgi:signal transduction histidine kinase
VTVPVSPLDALDERRLRRLIQVGPSLGAELRLDVVLDRLLSVARELTGARYAAVGVLADNRRELSNFVTQGIDEETHRAIGDLPRGHGVLGVLIRDRQPLRLHDVSEHPLSYGFPPGHPPMRGFLGVPVAIAGEAWGNLYLTEKAEGDFDEADEQTAMVLAGWAGIAIEQARLHQQTAAQRDELAYTVRALEATTLITRALGGKVDLDETLELIVKRGRALSDARAMLILLESGDHLVISATAGEASVELQGARVPVQGSASGRALLSGRPQRVPDFAEQLELTSRRSGLELKADQFVSPGTHPALFVPMHFRGRTLGVLNVIGRMGKESPFTEAEEQLMLSFATSAATAVATAQSVESDRLRLSLEAMEQERGRWARELHDETLQGLAALRVLMSSAKRAEDRQAVDAALETAVGQINEEIRNLRALITDLRPAALDELGLAPALDALIQQRSGQGSFDIEKRIHLAHGEDGTSTRLAPELETAIYRVVQEALTNVVKHAQANHARVEVMEQNGFVSVLVEDDGVGFDPEASHTGFGLLSMRERVELGGGELELSSGGGTTRLSARFAARHIEAGDPPRVESGADSAAG